MDGLYPHFGCLAGRVWLGLQPNGDVAPCPLLNVPLGNLLQQDLRDMLGASEVMGRLLNRDDRAGRCGTCDDRWRCGGCRAHAFAVSGDMFAEDPFCLLSLIGE